MAISYYQPKLSMYMGMTFLLFCEICQISYKFGIVQLKKFFHLHFFVNNT